MRCTVTSQRRSRPPPPPPDEFGSDEDTVVDGRALPDDSGEVTPDVQDHCVECGGVVFVDRAALQQSWPDDRCMRSWDGKRWHWCHKLKKSVTYYL